VLKKAGAKVQKNHETGKLNQEKLLKSSIFFQFSCRFSGKSVYLQL
jgi:hypothetical protein